MIKIRMKGITLALTVALALLAPVAMAQQGLIRIGLHNWPENVAVANMWKELLTKHGYDVKLTTAGISIIYAGIANKSLDVGLEVWMPRTNEPYYDRFAQKINLEDAWYRQTRLGLVVPSYVKVNSITQLNANKALFTAETGKPAIIGIGAGAVIMANTEQAIKRYHLQFDLVNSSSAGMMAALDRAIKRKKPIAVTLWNPHWAFAVYDLKYLKDPLGVYGGGENIHWMSRVGFDKDYPKVARALTNWDMTHAQLGSLMAAVRKAGNPKDGAQNWIENHRKLVNSWLVW